MRYVTIMLILLANAAVAAEKEKPVEVKKPKLTRENLSAHGFKQSEKDKDLFVVEHARLGRC